MFSSLKFDNYFRNLILCLRKYCTKNLNFLHLSIFLMAYKPKKGRPKKIFKVSYVTVFLRIFGVKNDLQWKGNEIQSSNKPLAERIGILRTHQRDKVKSLKKKAIEQFAKEFKPANLACEAVFVRPINTELKPMQVDTFLPLEHGREYTLILYLAK